MAVCWEQHFYSSSAEESFRIQADIQLKRRVSLRPITWEKVFAA